MFGGEGAPAIQAHGLRLCSERPRVGVLHYPWHAASAWHACSLATLKRRRLPFLGHLRTTLRPPFNALLPCAPSHYSPGLRTGYCGSLTTFGTWQVELMTEAISLNQWVNAIMAYIVGLAASLMAYIVGCHIALGIDRWGGGEQCGAWAGCERRAGAGTSAPPASMAL